MFPAYVENEIRAVAEARGLDPRTSFAFGSRGRLGGLGLCSKTSPLALGGGLLA